MEISRQTRTSATTVYNSLKSLEDAGFITKKKDKPSRGRPGAASTSDDRSFKYYIENTNFALKDDKYQIAPGYTKNTSVFLQAWSVLVDKKELDEVYSILMKILRQAMTQITSFGDPKLKQLRPNTDKSMQCQFCGGNHDARDFIRATLLHILDQFETSNTFMDYLSEKQFISKDIYEENHLLNQEKSKKEKQAKEWQNNLPPDSKHIVESILKKSPLYSLEQLMWKVNKLIVEQDFSEQEALSKIAKEQTNSEYDSKLSVPNTINTA